MPLPSTISTMGQQKLAGKISVHVEDDPAGSPGVFKPVGACIESAQLPPKARESKVAPECINVNCQEVWQPTTEYTLDDVVANAGNLYQNTTAGTGNSGTIPPTHTTGSASDGALDWLYIGDAASAAGTSEGVPFTTPGTQTESTFTFNTNHVPGSDMTRWFECEQESGAKYKWMLCHINGAQQILRSAWIQNYTPASFDATTEMQVAEVVLSLSDGWHYLGGESAATQCDGTAIP